ncbi:hypothetical protein EW146_g9798, partial [Bondarzewia mesenterica]
MIDSRYLSFLFLAVTLPVLGAPYSLSPGEPPYVGIIPARRRDVMSDLDYGGDPSSPMRVGGMDIKRQIDHVTPVTVQLVNIAPSVLSSDIPAPSNIPNVSHEVSQSSPAEAMYSTYVTTGQSTPTPTQTNHGTTTGGMPQSSQAFYTDLDSDLPSPTDTVMASGSKDSLLEPELTPHEKAKVAVIAAILSIIVGLMACVAIAKLTSSALKRRRSRFGRFDSKVLKEESVPNGFAAGSQFGQPGENFAALKSGQISPTRSASSTDSGSLSPPFTSLDLLSAFPSPPPSAVPSFPPPAAPAPDIPPQYSSVLLAPSDNLAQQNMAHSRVSFASDTTSITGQSLSRNTTASTLRGGHRRMRSAPVSIVASTRQSQAPSVLTTIGEEGFWDAESLYA